MHYTSIEKDSINSTHIDCPL